MLFCLSIFFILVKILVCSTLNNGPGSVISIATGYGLDSPGIDSRWGLDYRNCSNRPWDPRSLQYNGYRVFTGGKKLPRRDADPSHLLVPWSRKGRSIPSLALWAVRPVQSLSACTGVHFTCNLQMKQVFLQYFLQQLRTSTDIFTIILHLVHDSDHLTHTNTTNTTCCST